VDTSKHTVDESFEIKLRNHKKEAVSVRAVEHVYRCNNWEPSSRTHDYRKLDSNQIEFPVVVPTDGEVTIRYAVHYTWYILQKDKLT